MAHATKLWSTEVCQSACSVECCPWDGFQHLFVCGLYELDEKTQKKTGKVLLYEASYCAGATSDKDNQCSLIQSVDTAAVFDLKWCHHSISNRWFLGQASADGSLHLYERHQPDLETTLSNCLKPFCVCQATKQDTDSCLSLDWSNRLENHSSLPSIAVSTSLGNIFLLSFTESNLLPTSNWKAHEYEAWIVTFNCWNPHVLYTGSDDCCFKGWDCRAPTCSPIFFDETHKAGVSVVTSSPHNEFLMATGSYDDCIRVWDTRVIKKPLMLGKPENTGGGVWRLRWHPRLIDRLLAACIYNGFHVYSITDDKGGSLSCDVTPSSINYLHTGSYHEHKSLAYGADWSYIPEWNDICFTCSFYDKSLHMWRNSPQDNGKTN